MSADTGNVEIRVRARRKYSVSNRVLFGYQTPLCLKKIRAVKWSQIKLRQAKVKKVKLRYPG